MSYPPWIWPPLASDAPPPALTVSAGVSGNAFLGVPKTLAGSAAGGVPPYTFEWSVDSAPTGGVEAFVDDTDPTTDVTFTVAAGTYVLRLTATDSVGTVAAAQVRETAVAPLFLDTLSVQPLWAHWLGGYLRVGQTAIATVHRTTSPASIDLASFVVADVVDVAALETWSLGGDVELVDVHNAVASVLFPTISARTTRARVVIAGAAVVGNTGYLAAQFDGTDDPNTGTNVYERTDMLGLVGDVALTLCGDLAGHLTNGVQSMGFIGAHNVPSFPSVTFGDFGITSFYLGSVFPGGNYTEVDYGSQVYNYSVPTPDGDFTGWLQVSRHVGDGPAACPLRYNGGIVASAGTSHGAQTCVLVADASSRFAWGASYFAPQPPAQILSLAGQAANWFCWNAVLGGGDQALLDTWQGAHHA
jgi:hypothetical protein